MPPLRQMRRLGTVRGRVSSFRSIAQRPVPRTVVGVGGVGAGAGGAAEGMYRYHMANPMDQTAAQRRDRAKRLEAEKSPAKWRGTGPFATSSAIRHGLSTRKRVLTDPGSANLVRGVREWSHGAGPAKFRSGQNLSPGMKSLQGHLKYAPKTQATLYRGMTMSPERAKQRFTVGAQMSMPASSWSRDRNVAYRFSRSAARSKWNSGTEKSVGQRVVLRMKPGKSRALHVAPVASKYGIGMSEAVTNSGRVKVTGTQKQGKYLIVDVEPA